MAILEVEQPNLDAGEQLVKQGDANLQRGIETVGGRLFLTNRRLIFKSHRLNVQTGATEIALANVAATEVCWTKLLNLIPVAPNSLRVTTTAGDEHRYVLFGRAQWKEAIDTAAGLTEPD